MYATILEDHRRIIRAELRAHDGSEHGTEGDSFFSTFASPTSCIAAVITMQRMLNQHEWPGGEQPLVRMGIHTGEASAIA